MSYFEWLSCIINNINHIKLNEWTVLSLLNSGVVSYLDPHSIKIINIEFLFSEPWTVTCDNVVFENLALDMKQHIQVLKNVEEKACKKNCNFENFKCKSYFFNRLTKECILFKLKVVDFKSSAGIIGAPRNCQAGFDPCVIFFIFNNCHYRKFDDDDKLFLFSILIFKLVIKQFKAQFHMF